MKGKKEIVFDYSVLEDAIQKSGYELEELSQLIGHKKGYLKMQIQTGGGFGVFALFNLAKWLNLDAANDYNRCFFTPREDGPNLLEREKTARERKIVFYPDDPEREEDMQASIRAVTGILIYQAIERERARA